MLHRQHFIVATAGHVDHGKSALVKRLTGTDPDRLPEEKLRSITIDLGFAHMELPVPGDPTSRFDIGIVDVPGHEDFVKNMAAGVGAVDLALLVVAADDGWMPQTEEHLQILTYFGVRRAVVALSKADLAIDENAVVNAVRDRLRGTPLADAPIVPTSVVTGHGLVNLETALAQVLADTPPARDIGKPRLPVDRVFTLPGAGTVVTGTLSGGMVTRGQSMVIQPSGRRVRVRHIQSHGRDLESTGPASRAALNLADSDPGGGVHRGEVVTIGGLGGPHDVIDVLLEISSRSKRSVRDGLRVHVHYGSGNVAAHVALGCGKELAAGGRTVAQLRLESPAYVFAADHFILRDWSEQHTLAGGVVLDPDANRKGFRTRARVEWLQRVAASIDDPTRLLSAFVARAGAVQRSSVLLKSGFSHDDLAAALDAVTSNGELVIAGDLVVDAGRWTAVARTAADAIDIAHRLHPEHLGMSLTDLRTAVDPHLPLGALFDPLVAELCEREFVREGTVIRRRSHRAALPQPLQAAGAKLRQALNARPMDPPSRKELTPDPASQRAWRFLIDTGEVVEIGADLVMTAEAVAEATDRVRTFIRQHGPATVSDLRQMLGSSRRVVVPLLEHLDRTFVTLRQGDRRTVRR